MQTAPPVLSEDAARHETLAAQTQAVERAIQTMYTHLHELLTLEDLASVACLSPSHFHRVFRRLVVLSPRLLRQRAHAFEPLAGEPAEFYPTTPSGMPRKHALLGRISAPATFRGTIYVGLFPSPIPQGKPVRCTTLSSPGWYLLHGIADVVYYLRAAAFPMAADLHSSLLPGEKLLVGHNASPLVIRYGQVSGDPDLVLHPPQLTDPPLVMGLPLL